MFNLFTRKKTVLQSGNLVVASNDDIPRYPPFVRGLPAAQTSRIMQTQEDLIAKIRGALRFNQDQFNGLVFPVVERYAAYVHLLPASETHHHRGAGGLFRHGLEAGFWAAQRAESYQFCVGETPLNRRENEPRWQFASFLGGLLHDVGKPLSDVAVTDKAGNKEWNPYDTSLAEWFQRESIDHYFLRWRDKRNRRHKKFSMMNLDQIITLKAKSYLNKPGPHIMEALLEAIVGTGASEAITKIVMWADQESVRRDLINQRLDVDEYAYGVPVERFIFDALRRLVSTTRINEPGALIWRLEKGVFLAWNQIVPEIHRLIEKDRIPGVPRNPDTLADILIERGFAVPYQENTQTKPTRYWRICPEVIKGVSLNCLRLDDPELIFTNEPPAPVKAAFKTLSQKQDLQGEGTQPFDQADASRRITSGVPDPYFKQTNDFHPWDQIEESPLPESPKSMDGQTPVVPDDHQIRQGNISAKQLAEHQHPPGKGKAKSTRVGRVTELVSPAVSQVSQSLPKTVNKQPERQVIAKKQTPQANKKVRVEKQDQEQPDNESDDSLGWSLIHRAINRSSGTGFLLEQLPDGDFGIPYPASARLLGEPREIMNILSDDGLLRLDQASASKTSVIAGKKYLVLNRKVSRFVAEKMSPGQQAESSVNTGTQPSSINSTKHTESSANSTDFSAQEKSQKNVRSNRRKLPSQEKFGDELIAQIVQGYGSFIAGNVQTESQKGVDLYRVSIDSIQAMAVTLNTTPTAIRTMVRKTPSVKIRLNHDKGDYIEYRTEEKP